MSQAQITCYCYMLLAPQWFDTVGPVTGPSSVKSLTWFFFSSSLTWSNLWKISQINKIIRGDLLTQVEYEASVPINNAVPDMT